MKKTILIVDDNEDLTKGLKVFLRSHGYTTVIAGDAVSAISLAKNENPDLIILDLGLPAGDGYLVMEKTEQYQYCGHHSGDSCFGSRSRGTPRTKLGSWRQSFLAETGREGTAFIYDRGGADVKVQDSSA